MKTRVSTCNNHPQTETTQRCDRCSLVYCDECLQPYNGQRLCANCITELEEAERLRAEARRPFWQRWNRSMLPGLFWGTGIFVVVAILIFFLVRSISEQKLDDSDYARIIMATRMQMNQPVNVISLGWGTAIVSATSAQPDFSARKMIDGGATADLPGWRSQDASFPQEFVFGLHDPYKPAAVNMAVFMTVSDAPKDTWAKDVAVDVSDSPNGPWKQLGQWSLDQVDTPQQFSFDQQLLNGYVRLRILSNHGSHEYTSLGEFELQLQQR